MHAVRTHIATTLQRSLLPPRLPIVPGLTIAARFRAAGETTEVGGDFYDLFGVGDALDGRDGRRHRQGPGRGDDHVAGALHDAHRGPVRGARRAPMLRAPQRGAGRPTPTAARSAPRSASRIEPADGRRRLRRRPRAAAAIRRRCLVSADGRRRAGRHARAAARRVRRRRAGRDADVALGAGDALVLYTDGVTDTRGEDGDASASERLERAAARHRAPSTPTRWPRGIDEALQAFEDGQQRDDVAVLVLRDGGGAPTVVARAPDTRGLTSGTKIRPQRAACSRARR